MNSSEILLTSPFQYYQFNRERQAFRETVMVAVRTYIAQLVSFHAVCMIVLFASNGTVCIISCLFSDFLSVSGQDREASRPIGQSKLEGNQAYDVEASSDLPLVWCVYAEPSKPNGIGNDRKSNQNLGSESTEVCVSSQD